MYVHHPPSTRCGILLNQLSLFPLERDFIYYTPPLEWRLTEVVVEGQLSPAESSDSTESIQYGIKLI